MPVHTATLTDMASATWRAEFTLTPTEALKLTGSPAWSLTKQTFAGGPSHGIDVVTIDNGRLSIDVLPTRGMGLWKGRCDGLTLGWQSPVSWPVHPSLVNLHDRDGLGWLHGFNELLCRCGLAFNGPPGNDHGEPLTLHGRIANLPAHYVEAGVSTDGLGTLFVTGVVDETSMFGPHLRLRSTVSTAAGSATLRIVDEITNRGATAAPLQLLYHTNLGPPFLGDGARFVAAIAELAPRDAAAVPGTEHFQRYGPPTVGFAEQVYFMRLLSGDNGIATALLHNCDASAGVSLTFPAAQLPCFALWKNLQALSEGYVTGLEPALNFPNFRGYERERGRLRMLEPGETVQASLTLNVHSDADEIRDVAAAIEARQAASAARIHSEPIAEFSPG